MKDHTAFHIVTKVNGVVKQDGNTKNLIWDEAHMIRYLTSILTLYPGDVISSGTPDGVGAGRRPPEFLKPGDVVTIDIDGIGTLTTPMRALAAARQTAEGRMGRMGWQACPVRGSASAAASAAGRRGKLDPVVLALVIIRPQAQTPPADTILVNGHVDHRRRAVLDRAGGGHHRRKVHGGRARAPTSESSPVRRRPSIDLKGRTVIPGLADDHLHDAGGGPGVDLSRTRSIADVLAAIAARVKQSRPGDIIVTNSDWHEAQLKEHRLPYRRDLDTVSPDNPVVVVRGGHEYILNSAALRKWNITQRDAAASRRAHHARRAGELNGELVDRAKSLVQLPPASER